MKLNRGKFQHSSRQIVLGKLNAIFKDFVRTISIRNGLPEELANEVGGKIFTFGSYRLGVHGKGMCLFIKEVILIPSV